MHYKFNIWRYEASNTGSNFLDTLHNHEWENMSNLSNILLKTNKNKTGNKQINQKTKTKQTNKQKQKQK